MHVTILVRLGSSTTFTSCAEVLRVTARKQAGHAQANRASTSKPSKRKEQPAVQQDYCRT
jgi:hypothetical protein